MTTITWLGHAGFLFEASSGSRLLVDAWRGGPTWPAGTDLGGVEVVAVTHGHFDHCEDAPAICQETGATLVCIHEVSKWAMEQGLPEAKVVGMNKGGTFEAPGGWKLTMVQAVHSGGCPGKDGQEEHGHHIIPGGAAAGFVIESPDGERIYHAGDTAAFLDMQLIRELWEPQVALLPIGGHFTMGPREAAKAVELLGVDHVVPMHYGTFPILAGTPDELREHCPQHVAVNALAVSRPLDVGALLAA